MILSHIGKWGRKSEAVARITFRQQIAYRTDFFIRSFFLLMILFVFSQLWSAAYGGDPTKLIAGYSLKEIVWYLAFTEVLMLSAPQICSKVEEEVKNGDIAIRLIRPLSYVGYHYSSFMAEAAVRFVVNLAAGSLVAWLLVGPPDFGFGWLGFASLSLGALTIIFLLHASVALCSFWVEEVRGLEFVLQKLQFTIGGMLIPIALMPEWLQRICAYLPFQATLYFSANAAVHFDSGVWLRQIGIQAAWIVGLAAIVSALYARGVAKLHVNGG